MQYIVTWEYDGSETMVDTFSDSDGAYEWEEFLEEHLPYVLVEVHARSGRATLKTATDEMRDFIREIAPA